ncbi:MAG TPA: Holliday junction branch migration protein RuvA [Lachnospiraceae bacterium]|nr:Holliday junction branch migration protein RuvA [Lachnospiraceae bacterium]
MYAYIIGALASCSKDSIVLENNGIGYNINVPATVINGGISVGDELKIYTYLSVREDAMQLFGFLSQDDLDLFKLLLGVSGIGPKGALGILSGLTADELRFAVLSDDSASISKAPGIGKKTAQKIILELKDKLNLTDAFEKKAANVSSAGGLVSGSAQSEAVLALTALGYPDAQALKAVKEAAKSTDIEDVEKLLKAALKEL